MITYFPALVISLLYCTTIKTTKLRRVAQGIIIFIYSMLGAMYV